MTAVFTSFDDAHATLQAATDLLPEGLRSQRPAENRWSVNEVLEHLSIVEMRFAATIGKAVAAARQAGLGPENGARAPLPARTATMLVDRTTPRTAPEQARPTGTLDSREAWAAVERSRETVRNTLTSADGLALSEITYSHPFFGPLTPYQWVEFLAGHRLRHAEQIREAARQLAGA